MPKLIIEGKPVVVRWLKEWDRQIILIGKTFRKKGGYVDWKAAFDADYLKGMPALDLYAFSKRLTTLKMRKKPDFLEKRRKYRQEHRGIRQSKHGVKIRTQLYMDGTLNSSRKKHQCPPRDLWTDKQHEILKALAMDYRRGKSQVDWEGVMGSFLINFLPKKYQKDLPLLRKYYQVLKRIEDPKLLIKRRKDALRWKNENKDRYLKNASKRKKNITKVTREFLLKKVPLY